MFLVFHLFCVFDLFCSRIFLVCVFFWVFNLFFGFSFVFGLFSDQTRIFCSVYGWIKNFGSTPSGRIKKKWVKGCLVCHKFFSRVLIPTWYRVVDQSNQVTNTTKIWKSEDRNTIHYTRRTRSWRHKKVSIIETGDKHKISLEQFSKWCYWELPY